MRRREFLKLLAAASAAAVIGYGPDLPHAKGLYYKAVTIPWPHWDSMSQRQKDLVRDHLCEGAPDRRRIYEWRDIPEMAVRVAVTWSE